MMKKYAAEFVGTFVLVFGGCGSAVLAGGHIGFLGVSIAFGLTLLAMAYAIGPISGCHINPAVTLGLLLSKKMPAGDVAGYVAGQVLGGIAAAGLLLLILKGGPNGYDLTVPTNSFAANGYGEHSPDHYGLLSAFLVEVILTFFLVFTVLGTTDIKAPVGFRGHPHRAGAGADPPGRHPRDQHLGQPGPEHQPGRLRRRLGAATALAVHRRPVHRRGHRVLRLFGAADGGPGPRPTGFGASGRGGPAKPAGRAGVRRACA